MNLIELKKELIHFEGYRTVVYKDSLGLPTCGIGHMDKQLLVGTTISADLIDAWYEKDIRNAIAIADRFCDMSILDDVRQRTIVQLAFNLGNRLFDFKQFQAAVKSLDWPKAVECLKDSKWYTQVGRRGPETCATLLGIKE
jgi:lysozyme